MSQWFRDRPCGLMDKALVFGTKDCRFESCQGHALRAGPAGSCFAHCCIFVAEGVFASQRFQGQFARVVKGLDLRSNAGNCAWVRTPQLAYLLLPS